VKDLNKDRKINKTNEMLRREIKVFEKQAVEHKEQLLKLTEVLSKYESSYIRIKDEDTVFKEMEATKHVIKWVEKVEVLEHTIKIDQKKYTEVLEQKLKLLESEKAQVRLEIYDEATKKLRELEANILAYQDYVIELKTEKKAQFKVIENLTEKVKSLQIMEG